MMDTETSFGAWVKHRRRALDMTQQELARRVGCSTSTVFKIETDERRPSRQIAELLANHLEVEPEQRDHFLKVARRERAADTLGKVKAVVRPVLPAAPRLPLPPGPLMGREFELAEIMQLIRDPGCRLLTLTGQGGIGKTHLAGHLILALAGSQQAIAAFVSLTPVSGREQTVTAIADTLGIVLYAASDRAEQLIAYLQDKELVLVLDNFEHLAQDMDCTALIGDLLRGTRHVRIIITSRHPLQLQAEWVFEVQGLPVPSAHRPEELETSSSVALFIQRAKQAAVGFKPSSRELLAIARICELVDGLPLGIELAAGWVPTLTCEEIAREIQISLDFLATSKRDLPERHRSLRATLDHSWKLLKPEEQRILRCLAVFRGGFSRQAAREVADASLADLQSLVSKSLIRRAASGRYDMHELILQFARSRIERDPTELEQTLARHSRYFSDLLERSGPALKGADRNAAAAELISDLPNLRQAWQWAASHAQAREISQSADTLFWLYESRSNCREGVPMYAKAIEGLQGTVQTAEKADPWEHQLALGQALCYKGYFLFRQGQHPKGRDTLKDSLAVLQEISGRHPDAARMALSNTIVFLGTVSSVMGEFDEGEGLLQEGLRLKQELGDRWGAAFCLRQIGRSAHTRGEYGRSCQALEKSLALGREIGSTWAIASSLILLGIDAQAQGRYDQARVDLSDGLALSRALEDRASIAVALGGLGMVESSQGRYEEAQRSFQESLSLCEEIGEQGSLAQTLIHYGEALLQMGDRSAARQQLRRALSVARDAQITPAILEALTGEAEIRLAEGEAGPAQALAWAVSRHPACPYAARSRAQKLVTDLGAPIASSSEESRASAEPTSLDSYVGQVLNP